MTPQDEERVESPIKVEGLVLPKRPPTLKEDEVEWNDIFQSRRKWIAYGKSLESLLRSKEVELAEARNALTAARNRIADDAGIPVSTCIDCGLPLNSDHTHRTYEEHDLCRNTRHQQ